MIHKISAWHLTQDMIDEIITKGYKIELDKDSRMRIQQCRDYLLLFVHGLESVIGRLGG